MEHEDLLFECAGINHIAWMTRLEVEGEDAYPRLFAAMEDPDVYAKDKVRFELMRRFGYFVTESSEHNAEYVPYFLKDDELIELYDVPVDEYVRRSEENLVQYAETRRKLLAGEDFSLGRSVEYGSLIMHSLVTGEARAIYGNVENTGLVTNLPQVAVSRCRSWSTTPVCVPATWEISRRSAPPPAPRTPLSRTSRSGRLWRVGGTTSITPPCSTVMPRVSSHSTR